MSERTSNYFETHVLYRLTYFLREQFIFLLRLAVEGFKCLGLRVAYTTELDEAAGELKGQQSTL